MNQVVGADRWATKGAARHARNLLGNFLVRETPAGTVAGMITEVEAYDGERDLACHARVGRTARTETMYAAGGVWYVYLCYGIHEMLNLVVGPRDWPSAVLIRGLDCVEGPGRLTKRFGIDRRLNGVAATRTGGLWIEDRGVRVPGWMVRTTPRIGVDYAGPVCAAKPWRFTFDPAELTESRARGRRVK